MTVRAVVFDVGNVLYRWDRRALFAKLIADEAALDHFLGEVASLDWHEQHDAGRPIAEMVAERCLEYPDHAELLSAYHSRWLETIPGPVPGVHEIVRELAARDVPLYAITNFGGDFWRMFRPTAPVFDLFGDIVVSGDEKLMKPDPAIYALALKRFGLPPGEGLFVDDNLANVEAARANGFEAHHFVDVDILRSHLAEEGVL